MNVTIHPPAVTAMGVAARDVGDTTLRQIPGELSRGEESLGGARIGELAANGAAQTCLSTWTWTGRAASSATLSIGSKLVLASNTYASTDTVNTGLFERSAVPAH